MSQFSSFLTCTLPWIAPSLRDMPRGDSPGPGPLLPLPFCPVPPGPPAFRAPLQTQPSPPLLPLIQSCRGGKMSKLHLTPFSVLFNLYLVVSQVLGTF